MRRVGVDDEFASFSSRFAGTAHALDGVDRNALIGAAVESEHRSLEVLREIDRMARRPLAGLADELAVPGNARPQGGVVLGIEPRDPAAPAKAGDPEPRCVGAAGGLRKSHRRVEVGHHLLVRHFRDDLANDLLNVGHAGDAALAVIKLGGNRHVALLRQPPADVLEVLVHAENFLHDEN